MKLRKSSHYDSFESNFEMNINSVFQIYYFTDEILESLQ